MLLAGGNRLFKLFAVGMLAALNLRKLGYQLGIAVDEGEDGRRQRGVGGGGTSPYGFSIGARFQNWDPILVPPCGLVSQLGVNPCLSA